MTATLLALAVLAQTTPVQPIVKGTALPPRDSIEGEVMAPVTALLAGFAAGDGAAVARQVRPDGAITTVAKAKAVTHAGWDDFARGLTPATAFEVRLSRPAIEIDGDIAMVWAPYVLRIGGTMRNCGMSHFDLIRAGGAWKVLNLTSSARTDDCGE